MFKHIISRSLISILAGLFSLVANAGTEPKFTVVPLTPTNISLLSNQQAQVSYQVTNQTLITRTLTMVPVAGISQISTTPGACSNPFTLASQQSCTLVLNLSGAILGNTVVEGPKICKTYPGTNYPDPFLCSQPSEANILRIKQRSTLSGTVSGLSGTVVLLNNGRDPTAINTNGSFTFSVPVAEGNPYSVTIGTQPATQTCTVINGSGIQGGNPINNVTVTCTTNTFTVGGTVSGLVGTVTLSNNGGNPTPISANGTFTFSTPVNQGTPYSVTIATQPSFQTCTVTNGSGTIESSNVTNVTVTCSTNNYTIGGNVSGLTGTLILRNNGSDPIVLNANGPFTFPAPLNDGSTYQVTIAIQPIFQTCTIVNGSGTLNGANVTDVIVTCSTNTYTVGGNVSGLVGSVTLRNNGVDPITINADGSFTFPTPLSDNSTYLVSVATQPPTQICTVTNESGTLNGANVTNVLVTCSNNAYTVGGTVSGLVGTVILNNGSDSVTISANGSFTFPTPIVNGSLYTVTIATQPDTQTCVVGNATGTINGANVANVSVTCTTNTYTIGGNVTGLSGGTLTLNNGSDSVVITNNGAYTFPTPVDDRESYTVTIGTQPTMQVCVVENPGGVINDANVTNINVTCTSNAYTVGGRITGLTGTLELVNNGVDPISISTDGPFTFPTPLTTGDSYAVTISFQPSGQTCSVFRGTGTVMNANVTNIRIACSINSYTLGGTVTGLIGTVALSDGTDTIIVPNGAFTFPTALADGSLYEVSVTTQPIAQTCSVSNGTGQINGANVTTVQVTCDLNTHTVGGNVNGLLGAGPLTLLLNNNVDSITITADGAFTFPTPLAVGTPYSVTVGSNPPIQNCTVSNESGTILNADITDVAVNCVTNNTTLSVSSTGVIPVNNGTAGLTITNTGPTFPALNVQAVLPAGWVGVTQDASNCTNIPPGGASCTLLFSTTTPYIAQGNITVTGDNITNPPQTALAFTANNYLIWQVTPNMVSVIDGQDLPSTLPYTLNSTITSATSFIDGIFNTALLVQNIGSAGAACYNLQAPAGTWFLPAICQLGSSGGSANCNAGTANITDNLIKLNFGGINGSYWSSTESDLSYAWYLVTTSSITQAISPKQALYKVRCARNFNLPI